MIIERISESKLERTEWQFNLSLSMSGKVTIVLDGYTVETRPTKHHGFKIQRSYIRLRKRNSNLDLADVPLFHSIIEEAKAAVIATITVSKEWPR